MVTIKNSSDQDVELFDETDGRLYVIPAGQEIEFVDETGNRLLELESAQKLSGTRSAKTQDKPQTPAEPKSGAEDALA